MPQTVLLVNPTEMEKMKDYYRTSLVDKLPPGSIFSARMNQCAITAYKSGKVLFQGNQAEQEASKWKNVSQEAPTKKPKSTAKSHSYSPPEHIASMSIIGSDEVGTGDYFGPITVVAAYVKKEQIPLLKELGVQDSKNLKDPQIIQIAKSIKDAIPFSLLTCDNGKYNELQSSGMSQGKIKALLHNQAIKHVLKKIAPEKPEGVLIDQFAEPSVFFNYLKGRETFKTDAIYMSTKAEGIHLSVAAASILARYAFIQRFDQLSEKAGFTIPKGAGAKVDEAAARLIKEKGMEALNEFTKVHFANTGKAKALYNRNY